MSHESVFHNTVTLKKSYAHPPAKVFGAWADPEMRQIWGTPSPEVALRIDQSAFEVGGEDVTTCMVGDEPMFVVRGRYHDIVTDRRILYTETISSLTALEGACLVCAEFLATAEGTTLVLTLQATAVDDAAFLDGVGEGWTGALEHLATLLG